MTQAAPRPGGPRRRAHSVVVPHSESAELRVQIWSQALDKLGVELPDFVVHDFGLLLAVPSEQLDLIRTASNETPNGRKRSIAREDGWK